MAEPIVLQGTADEMAEQLAAALSQSEINRLEQALFFLSMRSRQAEQTGPAGPERLDAMNRGRAAIGMTPLLPEDLAAAARSVTRRLHATLERETPFVVVGIPPPEAGVEDMARLRLHPALQRGEPIEVLLAQRPLPWRVGRRVGRTLYDGHDQLIGMMDTPELAAAVVATVNRTLQQVVSPLA